MTTTNKLNNKMAVEDSHRHFITKVFIITDSWDSTSDIIVGKLENKVFRLNTDLIRQYTLTWDIHGFVLGDPTGRTLQSSDIGSVYWRKPFTSDLYDNPNHPDAFFYAECRYAIREMYNFCLAAGARALIEEGAERRLGKIRQLNLAAKYFSVPEWRVVLGCDVFVEDHPMIVKSLSGEQVSETTVLYTTRVDGEVLDKYYLWLIQKAIEKKFDVTIVYIDGAIFGFRCNKFADVIDWRERIADMLPADWEKFKIEENFEKDIRAFMKECDLLYGRIDFVADSQQNYFLEVNPNGQWAWLDLDDSHGLLSTMIKSIERQ